MFRLETRVIIKISTHLPTCYTIIFDWFEAWGKQIFFYEKKNPKWPTQKTDFFKTTNSQYFVNFSGIGPWISMIIWCERNWGGLIYMVARLSKVCSKGEKNAFLVFSLLFWAYVGHSLTTIQVEPHWCSLHKFILPIQGPISGILAKKYWELEVLKNSVFLSLPFWISLLHPHENPSKIIG